jgi:hypothetical protein
MLTIITIYIIGFFLTLTFFKYFGVKIGFDYTRNANDIYHDWYDDWENNEQAFTTFSIFWPVIIPMLLLMGIWKIVFKFGKWFLNK